MHTTRFSCSERSLCNIAGVPFDAMTQEQRNHVRILNMYFNTPETYHNNVITEITQFTDDVNLTMHDFVIDVNTGVSYATLTATGKLAAVTPTFTRNEMVDRISQRLSVAPTLIDQWSDQAVESAFKNLGLEPKINQNRDLIGYLLVDDKAQYPRFKVTDAEPSNVVARYTEYVKEQNDSLANPKPKATRNKKTT